MWRSALAMLATSACLLAQDVEWNDLLHQRMVAGQDLIELRYRRDENGLLEVASCEGGARRFAPLFPPPLHLGPFAGVGLSLMLMFAQGECGVLGSTDSDRHLRRAGIEVGPVPLRQFLIAPFATGDPVGARVELLDRMVAIDWLQRGGHAGAVAELTALSTRADTPPWLAARATAALEAFGRRPVRTARRRLTPETLLLPTVADAYLAVDHARLPDLAPLRALARRLAVDRSYRVLQVLRAPTPDDLFYGQFVADMVGELPFEVARRFGNLRCDHTVAAIVAQTGGAPLSFGWSVQTTGEFEHEVLAAELEQLAASGELQCERRGDSMHVVTPAGEAECSATALRGHSKGMGGRLRPELARELLAEGPAFRLIVPPASRLWLALASLDLPPAQRAEVTASFGDGCRLCVTITARDEDAAAAWVARASKLLASAVDDFRTWAAANYSGRPWLPGPANGMQPLVDAISDAIAATRISADGCSVQAVLASKMIGPGTLWALRSLVQ